MSKPRTQQEKRNCIQPNLNRLQSPNSPDDFMTKEEPSTSNDACVVFLNNTKHIFTECQKLEI